MSSDRHEDRRGAERVAVNHEFADVDDRINYVSNLSVSGAFVHTGSRHPIGAIVELQFTVLLDDPVVIRGRARVVRHSEEPAGLGVEFVDLEPAMVLRLHDVVARRRVDGLEVTIPRPGLFEHAFARADTSLLVRDDDDAAEILTPSASVSAEPEPVELEPDDEEPQSPERSGLISAADGAEVSGVLYAAERSGSRSPSPAERSGRVVIAESSGTRTRELLAPPTPGARSSEAGSSGKGGPPPPPQRADSGTRTREFVPPRLAPPSKPAPSTGAPANADDEETL